MTPADSSLRFARFNSSVVLVAHDVNLSIFNPLWLTREGVLREGEIDWKDSVFAPGVIRISTSEFELMVMPNRIQMRFAPERLEVQSDLLRVMGSIVSKLPHTPYTAVGINSDFLVAPTNGQFAQWNRAMFRAKSAANGEEESDRFGAYFSRNMLDMQARIDCKPIRVKADMIPSPGHFEEGQEAMQISVNFHSEIQQPSVGPRILERLGKWEHVTQAASDFIRNLEKMSGA